MAARKFKFVSPGVFLKEIDNSQLPREPGGVGPVIIGRTRKGPSMKPVKVGSFQDFVTMFGETVPGNQADDPWRNPGLLATAYAPYAAQAYFNSQAPVTMIRLAGVLGDDASASTEAAQPGWDSNYPYGLFLIPSSSASLSGSLVGIVYTTTGSVQLGFKGTNMSGTANVVATGSAEGTVIKASDSTYTIVINDGTNTLERKVSFLEGPTYIRDVLNTNPVKTNTEISSVVSGTLSDKYWLGETFDEEYARISRENPTLNLQIAALPLTTDMGDFKGQNHANAAARTGWVFPQHVASSASYAPQTGLEKLFRIIALHEGEEASRNLVVQIENIRIPDDGSLNPYGTFSVAVYMITPSRLQIVERFDRCNLNPNSQNFIAKKIGDQYFLWDSIEKRNKVYGSNPNVSQFIRIDVHADIAETGPSNVASVPFGFFGPVVPVDVASSFVGGLTGNFPGGTAATVKVEITDGTDVDVDETISLTDIGGVVHVFTCKAAQANASGEFADHANAVNIAANVQAAINYNSAFSASIDPIESTRVIVTQTGVGTIGNARAASTTAGGIGIRDSSNSVATVFAGGTDSTTSTTVWVSGSLKTGGPGVTGGVRLQWPSPPTVLVVSGSVPSRVFGSSPYKVDTSSKQESSIINRGWIDYHRRLPNWAYIEGDQTSGLADGTSTKYAYTFSMDDIIITGVAAPGDDLSQFAPTDVRFVEGSHVLGSAYTATSAGTARALTRDMLGSFRVPLVGGFDGVDITEADPFNMRVVSVDATTANSYAYASIDRAIDLIRDAESIEMNLAAMPGITNEALTTKLVETCEARADTLAVIDLPDVYIPPFQSKCTTFEQRLGANNPTAIAAALTKRQLNSSYGATYYPWVKIRDNIYTRDVWVPPSVIALGVMAYTEEQKAVWFAPAGFNRGGLNEGNAGLPVLQVTSQLLSKQRDTLYEANINPIASFVTEGLVVFGQKTLQTTQSALDRINVRRLLIFIKREVSRISNNLLFDQNLPATWNRFKSKVVPFLEDVKVQLGLSDFKVILDETTTTPDLVDRNIMYAKIFLKPARAIEFIAVDFVITNTGASFDD